MKKSAPLLSLTAVCLLAQCNKVQVQSPQAAAPVPVVEAKPSVPIITEHASPHFLKVASQLELGGSSFNYADQEGLMNAIAALLDDAVKNIPAEQRKDFPSGFSFVKAFDDLGLTSIKAIGASSRLTDSGLYHSRSYALTPGGRKGLLSLQGGPAESFLTHELAPEGTDFALEFPLHLKTLGQDTLAGFLNLVPAKERPKVDAALDQPVPNLGITNRELIQKLDARIGLFLQVHPEQQLPLPSEVPLPGADLLLVADRIGWILEPLKQQFMPMLSTPMLPVEVVDKDGIFSVTFKQPVGPAPMDFQPMLRFDSKADRLLISTRASFLNAALEGKKPLSASATFKAAWTGLPEKGNSAIYLSPVMLETFRKSLLQSIQVSKESDAFKEAAGKVLGLLTPYISQAQALCVSNQAEGTLGTANLSFPLSNSSSLGAITSLAVLSSLAVPTFNSITVKANDAKIGNEGRQLGLALQTYAADHNGSYPQTLEDLKLAGLIEALPTETTWLYNPALNTASQPESIVLASEVNKAGKRCVIRLSGISEFILESQFEIERDPNLQ